MLATSVCLGLTMLDDLTPEELVVLRSSCSMQRCPTA